MSVLLSETTTTTTTTGTPTKNTQIHTAVTMTVIIIVGLIILAGSTATFFIRNPTVKNFMRSRTTIKQTYNKHSNRSYQYQDNSNPFEANNHSHGNNNFQDNNSLLWRSNGFQEFTDQIYSRDTGNAYIYYNGHA